MRHRLDHLSGSGPKAANGIRGPGEPRGDHPRLENSARPGFTLVELLVVMGILLLITAVTLSAINMNISGDRIRGAARQVQSYIEGARGRASYGGNIKTNGAGYQCGVRFIRDANNSNLITSMQFVETDPANASIIGAAGSYSFWRTGSDITRLVSADNSVTQWYVRSQQGLIFNNQTILINGRKYQINISALTAMNDELHLVTPLLESAVSGLTNYSTTPNGEAVPAADNTLSFKLILAPQPMANQEPRLLGNGVVLDLGTSKGLSYFTSNSLPIDIMFSPRGTVVGPLAATGIVQFVVADREDSLLGSPLSWTRWLPGQPYAANSVVTAVSGDTAFLFTNGTGTGTSGATEPPWVKTLGSTTPDNGLTWTCVAGPKRERLIVSLTPQTGKTAVHPIYIDPAGTTSDPYRYAETGEVAAQ